MTLCRYCKEMVTGRDICEKCLQLVSAPASSFALNCIAGFLFVFWVSLLLLLAFAISAILKLAGLGRWLSRLGVAFLLSTAWPGTCGTALDIQWNTGPATESITQYSIYERVGVSWTRIGDTPTNYFRAENVTAGVHEYRVSSWNIFGESPMSASAFSPNVPYRTPSGDWVATVVVEVSITPTGKWIAVGKPMVVTNEAQVPSNSFFRSSIDLRRP